MYSSTPLFLRLVTVVFSPVAVFVHCNQNFLFAFENSAVVRLAADPVEQRQIGSLRL